MQELGLGEGLGPFSRLADNDFMPLQGSFQTASIAIGSRAFAGIPWSVLSGAQTPVCARLTKTVCSGLTVTWWTSIGLGSAFELRVRHIRPVLLDEVPTVQPFATVAG